MSDKNIKDFPEIVFSNNIVVPFEIDALIENMKTCNLCGTSTENIKYYDMEFKTTPPVVKTLERKNVPFCESCIKELTKTGVKNNVHS